MNDEELIAWVSNLQSANFKTYPKPTKLPFLTPVWHAARDKFEAHPYGPGISGLTHALNNARHGELLALAMLREFHVQYALHILTS